jgi:hypothetical protein
MEPGSLHPEDPRNWSLETMQFAGPQTWEYFLGVSINMGTQKGCFIMENPNLEWMIWGEPLF